MLLSKDCLKKYGDPHLGMNMTTWKVPIELAVIKALPTKIYCNKDMVGPLGLAFTNLLERGLGGELHSFDGCFNIRQMRGSKSMSLHSWGVAVDLNASTNQMGSKPTLTPEFVKCFTDVGFDWGGDWKNPDGMHFQLRSI
jgi:hypothetical protein